MRYIETLREGERIQEIYLCRQRTTAMTKTGKEYENVILQDKTGSLDAKIWDPHSMGIDEFDALDYVEVNGDVTVFNGQTQLSIKRARKISETDVDPTNYLPCTNKNIDEMMMELTKFIASVNNPYYKQVLTKLFIDNTEFAEAFKKHSSELVRAIMETELVSVEGRHKETIGFWDTLAAMGPAWGMIGTLIGLVDMLYHMDDPSTLGPAMAVALITTLYGSLLANWICTPVSNKLKADNAVEMQQKEVMIEGLLSIQAGENPRVIEEKLKSFLPPKDRTSADGEEEAGGEA